ncbi:MAG: DUF3726 domain-containing protein [Pseudomonadota bacterium]
MTHSLGEIDSLARRAARGAGMSWGLAEEAGQAVAWLSAHGLPGADDLAALLQRQDNRDHSAAHPMTDRSSWKARDGALCPIAAGAALSDRADDIAQMQSLRLLNCDMPFLLLPFLASIAQRTGVAVRITVAAHDAVCSPKGLYLSQDVPDADSPASDVTLVPQAPLQGMHIPRGRRATPNEHALTVLTQFADRLYAPETEARRRTGAGEDS